MNYEQVEEQVRALVERLSAQERKRIISTLSKGLESQKVSYILTDEETKALREVYSFSE